MILFTYHFFILLSLLVARETYAQLSDGPLVQPPTIESSNGELDITLSLEEADHESVVASTFHTRLFDGRLPGPTLAIRRGEWLRINFQNELTPQPDANHNHNEFSSPDTSNLHFHGAHVSGELPSDDVTYPIPPQQSFQYQSFFPEFHMPGTHWIHPHHHGSGTIQVGGGAAMALIVKDEPGEIPPEVENAEDILLFVQHFDMNTLEGVVEESRDELLEIVTATGVGGSFRLVNGQYQPNHEIIAGEFQRWRVVFASWDRDPLDLAIEAVDSSGECEMFLLAKDGIYIRDYPRNITKAPIPTAGRADIMVRCNAPGEFNIVHFEDRETLMTLTSVAPAGGIDAITLTPPTSNFEDWNFPSYLDNIRETNTTPGCLCETNLGGNAINGMSFDPSIFVHTVALGSVVERELSGVDTHPYHQHVYPFQLHVTDGIDTEDSEYFKLGDYHDVIMIRSTNDITVKYEANIHTGRIMLHCHRLNHEDLGMMSQEDVIDPADGGTCSCSPSRRAEGFTRSPTASPVATTTSPTERLSDPSSQPSSKPSSNPSPSLEPSSNPSTPSTSRPTVSSTASTTTSPTASPTVTTASPVATSCEDQTGQFTLETNVLRRCSWAARNNIDQRCVTRLLDGTNEVRDVCPVTCGACPTAPPVATTTSPTELLSNPSSKPSRKPSSNPSPSSRPSSNPSIPSSLQPTASLTAMPTASPTAATASPVATSCEDQTNQFTLETNVLRRCSWAERNRTDQRCALKLLDGINEVRDVCPVTCGACP